MASSSGNTFWLSFRVLDDGLDAAAARRLTAANSAPGGAGPAAFPLFPQLPTELRLKVWEYLLPGRVVQATCHDTAASASASPAYPRSPSPAATAGGGQGGYYRTYAELQAAQDRRVLRHGGEDREQTGDDRERGRQPEEEAQPPPEPQQIPVLLHVNHETRALALRKYELAFAWKVPHVLAVNTVSGTQSYYYPQNHFHPPTTTTTTTTSSTSPSSAHVSGSTTPQPQAQPQAQPAPPPPPPPPPQAQARTGAEARVYFSFARDMLYLAGELEPHDSFGFNSPMAYFVARADAARVRRAAVAFRSLRYGASGSQQIFGSLFHVVDRFGQGPPGAGAAAGGGAGAGAGSEEGEGREKAGSHGDGGGLAPEKSRDHGLLGNRVLVAVTPADEHTHALMGGQAPLVPSPPASPPTETAPAAESGGVGRGAGDREHGGEGSRGEEREEEPNVVQKIWRDWYRGSIVTSSLASTRFTLVREEDLARYL